MTTPDSEQPTPQAQPEAPTPGAMSDRAALTQPTVPLPTEEMHANVPVTPQQVSPEHTQQLPSHTPGAQQVPQGAMQVPQGVTPAPQGVPQVPQGVPQVPQTALQTPQGTLHSAPGEQHAPSAGHNSPGGAPLGVGPVSQPAPPAYGAAATPDGSGGPGAGRPGSVGGPALPTAPVAPAAPAAPKGRGGAMIAGVAIGAIIGALVGGGTAALVATNVPAAETSAVTAPAGTITLNDTSDVTNVSAVAAVALPSVVTIQVIDAEASGSGSGVVYTSDGYIITNNHVATLDGAATSNAQIRVRFSDGRVLDGTLVGTDPFSDLAVIKVAGDDFTPVSIGDSDALNVGDLAVVIGAPLNLPNTVTSGVISALYRGVSVGMADLPQDNDPETGSEEAQPEQSSPWEFRFGSPYDRNTQQSEPARAVVTLPVIQTDASINPGNSGGALLNSRGELIGINVAIASTGAATGTAGSDGLGFAIPSELAVRVADAIIAGERPSHGLLGVNVDESYNDTDEDANRAGALITALTAGGAADRAGLKVGDVVVSLDGIPVDSSKTLSALVRMKAGGSEAALVYTRAGVVNEVTVTLDALEW